MTDVYYKGKNDGANWVQTTPSPDGKLLTVGVCRSFQKKLKHLSPQTKDEFVICVFGEEGNAKFILRIKGSCGTLIGTKRAKSKDSV